MTKEERLKYMRDWSKTNLQYRLDKQREDRKKSNSKILTYQRTYCKKNRKRITDYQASFAKKAIDELSDYYVVNALAASLSIPAKIIREHPELIELKRLQMKLNRLIKEKNGNNIN